MDVKKTDQVLQPKKKPFKLSFAHSNLIGRSKIQIGKPLKLANTVSPKFYSRYEEENKGDIENLRKWMEYLDVKGPKERLNDPITENQRYGWYLQELTDLDRSDARLYFAIRPNPIIREHLMNYENIR